MTLLNQAVAVRKGVQSRVHEATTELHRLLDKQALFNGIARKFRPLTEDSERFPDESQNVQQNAKDVVKTICSKLVELIDIEATVDATNAVATADVVVDGVVLAKDVPATTLLFLEKELGRVRSDLRNIPELDPSEAWTKDVNSDLYVTLPQETARTKKVQKAIVLYPATPEHPAQTQMISEDQVAGYWSVVKMSGAMPKPDKLALIEKADLLLDAVKSAREKANTKEVVRKEIGNDLMSFLLK